MKERSLYKSPFGEMLVMRLYNQIIERWPVPVDTGRIDTRQGRTHALICGDAAAPPLILLHDANSNSSAWINDVEALSQHFRVYLLDIPGEPGKSSRQRANWKGPAYAEWLDDVLDGLDLKETSLVGHSYGGWIALKYAICQSNKLKKLVLLAPCGLVPSRISFVMKALTLTKMGKKGIERFNQLMLGEQQAGSQSIEFMELVTTYFRPRFGVIHVFSDDELKQVDIPVLLRCGENDAMVDSQKLVNRAISLLPQIDAAIIPGQGHVFVNISQEILPFLRS